MTSYFKRNMIYFIGILFSILSLFCKETKSSLIEKHLYPIQTKSNKFGFIDIKGNLIVDTVYDLTETISNKFYITKKNGYYKLINSKNHQISDKELDDFYELYFTNDLICLKKSDSLYFYNSDLKCKFVINGNRIINLCEKFIIYELNDKYGLVDFSGKIILKNEFDEINNFSNEYQTLLIEEKGGKPFFFFKDYDKNYIPDYHPELLVIKLNNKFALYSTNGLKLTKFDYDWIWTYSKDLLIAQKGDKYGFINSNGKEVTDFQFQSIGNFNRNFLIQHIKNKFLTPYDCVLNQYKKHYIEGVGYSNGLIKVKKNDKWGFIDKTGKFVINCEYQDVKIYFSELIGVKKHNKWGFINIENKFIIPNVYDDVKNFNDSLLIVKLSNKWAIINKYNKIIVKPQFTKLSEKIENHIIAISNNKIVILKNDGNLIKTEYNDFFESFENGIISVKYNGQWGLIDTNGNKKLDFIFDKPILFPIYFNNKFGLISKNNKFGIIDANFQIKIIPKYDFISTTTNGFFKVKLNGKWGIIDENGAEITKLIYDNIDDFKNGLALAFRDNISCYIDFNGNEIWKLK